MSRTEAAHRNVRVVKAATVDDAVTPWLRYVGTRTDQPGAESA